MKVKVANYILHTLLAALLLQIGLIRLLVETSMAIVC